MTILKYVAVLIVSAVLFGGCARSYSYSPTSSYSEGDLRDINDEDILKAFQAEPQIRTPLRVAWYNMSRDSLLHDIQYTDKQTVVKNYIIPKTLIEGLQPLFVPNYYYSPKPINFKAVRLLAARAKCDIVVLVTSRLAERKELNGWAVFNALLVPALFTPYNHVFYRYSSEVFVFDVRNGYMYRHLKFEDQESEKYVHIWEAHELALKAKRKMIEKAALHMRTELKGLFSSAATADGSNYLRDE